ncbi:MAG: serine/threonine protein kinase [Planctomycetota bacterium]|nr:MAG: serine/threonine protein kinase [Planctomycetota bacterium]
MDQPHTPGFAELQAAVGQLTDTERETLIGHLQSRSGEAVTQDPDATVLTRGGGAGADEDAPGSVIGRYKILECIGEGGFGSVFVAEQSEPVRRRVALKILKRGMDTQRVVARFAAERQALAMMDHPNIAKVLDAGQTPSGRPFFAMELVQGETITDYCDQSRLTLAERIELVRTVCAGVQHAHQKGIIHRDLKPSNVLVTQQDGRPMPKIIDFGIAKAIRGRIGDETVYTQVHQMIGTPIYMSPEQTGASSLDVDTRTDIYSLGVLLYELLTGVTPFDQEKTRQLGLLEMQRLIVEDTPPRPSARWAGLAEQKGLIAAKRNMESRRLGKALQGDLDWVVMKCLEKDRTRRYESAHALGEDLGRHLANEPVHAGRPSAGYLTRKFISRNRAQVAAGTAIVLLLVLGLGGTMVAWSRAREQSDRLRFTLDFFTRAAGRRRGRGLGDRDLAGQPGADAGGGAAERGGADRRDV